MPTNAQQLVRRGNSYSSQGNNEVAIGAFRQALKLDPNHVEARFGLANSLANQGKFAGALRLLDQLIQQHPELAPAHFSRGNVLFFLEKYAQAAASYRDGLAHDPNPAAYRNLAQAYQWMSRPRDAIQAYESALRLAPHDAEAAAALARLYQDLGETAKSRELLQAAVRHHPNRAEFHFQLGNVQVDQSHYEDALQAYEMAQKCDPQSAPVAYNIGHVLSLLGRWEASASAFRRAIELKPDYLRAYVEMGIAQVRLGDEELAAKTFRRCIELDPQAWEPTVCLGDLLARGDELDEAAEIFERAAQLRDDSAESLFRLGVLYVRQGRFDLAVDRLQRAYDLNPANLNALHVLGTAEWIRGAFEEAEDAFRAIIDINPACQGGYKSLFYLLIQNNRQDDATVIVQQWRRFLPDDPIARHLSEALAGEVHDRASDDYISREFDDFAASFDDVLSALEYRAPDLVAAKVSQLVKDRIGGTDILDIGCGTGLCAKQLAPLADRLVGVDLSAKMIDQAAKRKQYDELITAELTEYLQRCPNQFDVLVAADTLCYFGDLVPVFQAALRALRDRGKFVFTLEDLPADNDQRSFRLNLHGRFSHTESYVRRSLDRAGLCCDSIDHVVLRNEGATPVQGQLVVASLPASQANK